MSNPPILHIVVPCYNEEAVLPLTGRMFLQKIESLADSGSISDSSKVLFVDDGSKDATWKLIEELAASDPHYAGISLSRNRVLQEFSHFREVNIFLRGMFPMVGFRSTCVYYERHERIAGKSHYPLRKMLALALDGITSLSIRPIRIITAMGMFFALFAMALIIYALISFFSGNAVPGWASSLIGTSLIGGIQLISLGVIGEYIGKIYLETKNRPRYIIEKRAGGTGTLKNGEGADK